MKRFRKGLRLYPGLWRHAYLRSFWVTDYRHTLRICNIYCFSPAKTVTRTHLNACIVSMLREKHLPRRVSIAQTNIFCSNISIHFLSEDTKPAELWRDFVRVSDFILGYDAMRTYWLLPTFRRHLTPLCATFKNRGRMRDFRFPPRVTWKLRSSGLLRSE